ncbi:hypothetical protein FOBRF1_014669 [Fusarium oxysporum]
MPVYSADDLENAIADVKNGVSLKTAAKKNGLPPSTLRGRLTEDDLERWILRQEKLGHAPTHAQVRTIVRSVLARHGDHAPLGRKWTTRFVERHPALKTKLGRRTDWERVNAATPANIKRLFDVYETVDWIPPERRYNADEGGIMEGQGVNGLVIGSSQESPNASQKGDLDCIVVDGKSSSESEEDPAPVRRSTRVRRPTKRYIRQDLSS